MTLIYFTILISIERMHVSELLSYGIKWDIFSEKVSKEHNKAKVLQKYASINNSELVLVLNA